MASGRSTYWLGDQASYQVFLDIQNSKTNGVLVSLQETSLDYKAHIDRGEDFIIGENLVQVQDSLAIINIFGALVPKYHWYNMFFDAVSYEEIRGAITIALGDDNIKSILLNIDSPGGSTVDLNDLSEFILKADKSIKPIYSHTNNMSASAGYWLASSCREITAAKTALVGSIGAISVRVSYAKEYADRGVEFTYIRSGEFKALGQGGEVFSDKAYAEEIKIVKGFHKIFTSHIVKSRPETAKANIDEWSTGKVFLASEAMSLGLIDKIVTFEMVVAKLYKNSNNVRNSLLASTTDIEDKFMKTNLMTKDQMAKFASGVPLSDLGLSANNLKKAEEIIKAKAEGSGAVDLDKNPKAEASGAVDLDKNPKAEVSGAVDLDKNQKAEAEVSESQKAEAIHASEISTLNKQIGKLEGKIEALTESNTVACSALKDEIKGFESTQKELVSIVTEATIRLQVPLNTQAASLDGLSADAIILQYNSANSLFKTKFNTGSSSARTTESRESQESLKPKHTIKKVAE